jgi:hypothetical protein
MTNTSTQLKNTETDADNNESSPVQVLESVKITASTTEPQKKANFVAIVKLPTQLAVHEIGFDHKDFLWCPRYKATPRQFECTRSIMAQQVIQTLQPLIQSAQV